MAVGVNRRGYRGILGLQNGDSESERSWMALFLWLKGCGLTGVDLSVSDFHAGFVNEVRVQFQGENPERTVTERVNFLCAVRREREDGGKSA